MARRRRKRSVDWLIDKINCSLDRLRAQHEGLSLREKVLLLVDLTGDVKDLGVNAITVHGIPPPPIGGMERLRLYLIELVGQPIDSDELEVVAGVSEYARRIRQLRVEEGYQIATGASPDPATGIDLQPDQYLLVSQEPDEKAARRWLIANRIRRGPGGAKTKIHLFFQANVGQVVTTEELAYVSQDKRQYARRARELRTQDGWAIATRMTGRPDLSSGQYVLQSKDRRAEAHDRRIRHQVQEAVYQRDTNACRVCSWHQIKWSVDDPRILELHHLKHHAEGGPNVETNLIVICSKCHDNVHLGKHAGIIEKICESM